jgi:hypothetical protein
MPQEVLQEGPLMGWSLFQTKVSREKKSNQSKKFVAKNGNYLRVLFLVGGTSTAEWGRGEESDTG